MKANPNDKNLDLTRGGWILGWTKGTDCAIGARRLDTGFWVQFGYKDAIELLERALSREDFGRNGRLGVRGELTCPKLGVPGDAQVQFSISHARDW